MQNHSQFFINLSLTTASFAISAGISFFLTPFIVKSLGAAAYGFIGLSNNILSYTSLLTVALNAMAGRFISISYIRGDKENANRYLSSVFYSNLFISIFIFLCSIFFVIYIQHIIDVPNSILNDVRVLFMLIVFNSIVSVIANVYSICTFIKNRLDLESIRGIIGNVINAIFLVVLFNVLPPHVWYISVSSLAVTLYLMVANFRLHRMLTPDLKVNLRLFDWGKIKELVSSGAWNIINKLSDIFNHGFDLLFANIFVGASAMGLFSLTKSAPLIILGVFGTIAGVFAPDLTFLYAKGEKEEMIREYQMSIRLLGSFSTIFLSLLYVFSYDFYKLWLPTQNTFELTVLTIVGFAASPVTLPQESLWNVFTITNKLRFSSLVLLLESSSMLIIVLLLMNFVHNPFNRLLILAGTRTILSIIRNTTFLPMYSAHCLKVKLATFYPFLIKSIIGLVISLGLCAGLRMLSNISNWLDLCLNLLFASIICSIVTFFITLQKADRVYLINTIKRKI